MIKNDGDKGSHTQTMSLFIGGLMVFLGVWGIFFHSVVGQASQSVYWAAFSLGGVALFYFGYQNLRRASIATCLFLGTYFLVMGIINFLQLPINSETTFIMANYTWQGSSDYLLSLIASFFLFAGAFDWYRQDKTPTGFEKKFNPVLK